jgi:hypothetical protein
MRHFECFRAVWIKIQILFEMMREHWLVITDTSEISALIFGLF